MRLVSYKLSQSAGSTAWRAGIVVALDGDEPRALVDAAEISAAAGAGPGPWTVRGLLDLPTEQRAAMHARAQEVHAGDPTAAISVDTVVLGPPVPDPDKIICVGLNYRDHAAEAGLPLPPAPMLFAKYRNALVGPDATVPMPDADVTVQVDWEGELALVIGRAGSHFTAADALSHVAGYMVLNDVSARDLQAQTGQWLAGKTLDGFAPCGPCLVTADEVEAPEALPLRTTVSGSLVQDGTTADMVFGLTDQLVYISRVMSLEVGDIVATGTPAGVGSKMKPPRFLGSGDVVTVEIPGIGRISNTFVTPPTRPGQSGRSVPDDTVRAGTAG